METSLARPYEQFISLMTEEKLYIDPLLSFAEVCAWLGVPPKALDAVLTEELGVTGEAFMDSCRGHLRRHLQEKYGITLP